MLSFSDTRNNCIEATQLLLEFLKVKVTKTTLISDLEEHPDYPSLLSVSDILTKYGVDNLSAKFDSEKFLKLPGPFITVLKSKDNHHEFFTLVKEIADDTVYFFDSEKQQWDFNSIDDFFKKCSGVALLTEVSDIAGEKDYSKSRRDEKLKSAGQYFTISSIPIITIIACIAAFINSGINAILPTIFTCLTLAGCIVSVLLFWYELDQHNPLLKQICSGGKKVNCGAVLQSKASRIAGISWSAIGFSYFTGIALLLLFRGISDPIALFTVAWINVVAAPYVFFSIYYQWQVAKQWCVLCLFVQGFLVLQLATATLGSWHTLVPIAMINTDVILQIIIAFVIPFIGATIALPALQKAKENGIIKTELQKLKHNEQIFKALLQKQKSVTESPEGLGIVLGSSNPIYKVIKVCNPYCPPCATAHQPMEELMHNNPDVQVQILFKATNKEGDIAAPPVKHLLAIAENNDETKTKKALDDWYGADKKDYEHFAAKYPMNGQLKQQNLKIDEMSEWYDKMQITFTPTFFISLPYPSEDGQDLKDKYYQLPEIYNVNDLKYFLSV